MLDFLQDPKTLTGIVSAIVGIVAQIAASKGYGAIDKPTADSITALVVLIALGVMGSHAHVEHGSNAAEAHVEAARVATKPATPTPGA